MSKSKNSTSKSKSKKEPAVSDSIDSVTSLSRSGKIRLFIGFVLLLAGCFFTLSIISYCLSWKQDQHNLISSQSLWYFLFQDHMPVQNWCGRLGAWLAHWMLYRGAGIAAILFTLWLAGIGINIIYGQKILPTAKWFRWMALGFLFLCPLLSLLFADNSFPLGGALGKSLVEWTGGFAGPAGTIIMLIVVFLFFVFIVFQWDVKPWLDRAIRIIPAKPAADPVMTPAPGEQQDAIRPEMPDDAPEDDDMDDEEDVLQPVSSFRNKLKNGENKLTVPKEIPDEDNIPFTLTEDTAPTEQDTTTGTTINSGMEQPGIALEFPEDMDSQDDEPDQENPSPEEVTMEIAPAQPPEKIVPRHGAHITIQDNEPYDPALDLPDYKFPTLDLLDERPQSEIALDREELEKNKVQIIHTLRSFGIEIQRITATVGPTVTLYEIVPAEGVRISKIRNLEDDIALNLAALGIRIIAPIPGRGTIGIEVPNTNKQIVSMRSILSSDKFINNKMSLPIALGKKIDNENYIVDLATMPHLLMAGATGQGKSVGINAILVSLLYKKHPSQLKFVMVDPKKVELSVYRLIEQHYLAKLPNEEEAIITDTKKVINTVNALCIEMDNRYELLKDAGARNIKEYNDKFIKRKLNPQNGHKYLPFIILIIDEFADLIMTAGKEVEMPIARLAQLARAVGIHIVIATQRPSVNVITGIIKANFPARIAFKVSAKVDSRTILDAGGAEQLIGRGDMLVSYGSELLRLQCAFVDTPEVERIVDFIGSQRGYPSAFELPEYEGAEEEREARESVDLSKRDRMFEECARLVVSSQSGSTSMLQRKFNLGYNRAGRIMDQLEAAGIVGPASGSKPREVLMSTEYELEQHLESLFR